MTNERLVSPVLELSSEQQRQLEQRAGSLQEKTMLAHSAIRGGLVETMRTPQASSHHVEGETVRSHYRLMFDVVRALTGQMPKDRMKRLPPSVQERIPEVHSSVIETLKTYPNMMRAAILFHDIAKTTPGRTIKAADVRIPPDTSPEDVKLVETIRSQAAKMLSLQDFIEKNKRKGGKEMIPEVQKKLDDAQIELPQCKQDVHDAYEALREKYASLGVYEKFNIAIGFQGHEKRSAEILRMMDIDSEAKQILLTVVADHIIPLSKFEDDLTPRECARRYRYAYASYSDTAFRLAVALASVDLLGSVPASGHVNFSSVKNIFTGKREAWIQDRVKEEEKLLLPERLKGLDLPPFDYTKGPAEQKEFSRIKADREAIEAEVETELRKKYEAMYRET